MRRIALLAVALALTATACNDDDGGRPATLDLGTEAAATSAAAPASSLAPETGESPVEEETTATAETTAADTSVDPSTVTDTGEPPTTADEDVVSVPFPATDAAGVVALAALRPPGRIDYQVTFPEGSYTLTLAQDDERGQLHQSQDTGDVWIGVDTAEQKVTYFCTAAPGQTPTCKEGDPDGAAAESAREIAQIVGSDFIQGTFGPVAALPDIPTGGDQQVDRSVSCMATTLDGQDLRLCATAEGAITEITAGTTRAVATAVADEATAADLDPPAEPQ